MTSIKIKNEQLQSEINERRRAEEAAEQASAKLHDMVYEYSQRNREASLLNKMGDFLQACLSPEEAYPIIARYAPDLFPGSCGGLFMLNASENMVEIVCSWGEPLIGESMFPPRDCWAIRRGRLHLVEDLSREVTCHHLHRPEDGSYLCLPLMAQGAILGMVHLQNCQSTGQAEEDFFEGPPPLVQQKQLAVTFTEHIALALSNLKLRETLRHMAIRDPLTGLFNRRYLEETLEREIHRVNRKGTKLGVLMLDLDHFKGFNDCYGHEAGDALLRALGSYLKRSVRADDLPCRYGGEEFILVMPEISQEIALDRAETIREGVRLLQIQHNGQRLTDVTVSIGVAIFPDHGDTWESALKAADEALYKAKITGRNKVVAAGRNEYLSGEAAPISQMVLGNP
ncbi:MAG: sensor domain-containing diguanylate cyclase [Thermodesulfobacteriota bacterium]